LATFRRTGFCALGLSSQLIRRFCRVYKIGSEVSRDFPERAFRISRRWRLDKISGRQLGGLYWYKFNASLLSLIREDDIDWCSFGLMMLLRHRAHLSRSEVSITLFLRGPCSVELRSIAMRVDGSSILISSIRLLVKV